MKTTLSFNAIEAQLHQTEADWKTGRQIERQTFFHQLQGPVKKKNRGKSEKKKGGN